ncbi:hypothetical protein G5V58_20365 [Nocardioides anomalus]|uniref:Sulfotransferase family protein n=1 Tax=Nocardioides anomalus TaxID=2712223 RepID=A0A6G6WI27_9ACTN|nr:hypothetical protein [Nocardioides anomalus]QIG44817.1 hypothetical protein G5V58_20365 [Nocardioides anomalus]
MISSHERGFVFVATRMTAAPAVEIALSRVCGPDDVITPLPERDEVLRRAAGGRGPQHFLDPPHLGRRAALHMPLSAVHRMLGPDELERRFCFAVDRNPWDAVVALYHRRYRDTEPEDFAEYVASDAVVAFAARNHRAYRLRGRVAVDRVLRYESLAADLADVWRHLDLPGTPELPRVAERTRPSYRSYYDQASRDRVAELFADPIRELGYSF